MLCISSLYLFTCSCTRFVLKPFNGAKTETALEKKTGREKMSHTFLFTIRRCLTCSLYAISEIRESNQHLFPSMSSFNSPLLASSPPCHRIKHTPYLFILFYFYYYSSARKEAPQIPVTYNTLPAEPLIDFFDRNVLIRSLQMA